MVLLCLASERFVLICADLRIQGILLSKAAYLIAKCVTLMLGIVMFTLTYVVAYNDVMTNAWYLPDRIKPIYIVDQGELFGNPNDR